MYEILKVPELQKLDKIQDETKMSKLTSDVNRDTLNMLSCEYAGQKSNPSFKTQSQRPLW